MTFDTAIIRRDAIAEVDQWMKDMETGRVSTVEIVIRPYRKPGEQVSSSGKRDPQHREAKA